MASILQTWKKYDLGRGWEVRFLSDGSASFFNIHSLDHVILPKHSVETLRAAFRSEAEAA